MGRVLDGRARYVVLGAIVILAALLRFWGLSWGLHDAVVERRPHPDEWTIYWLFQWFDQHHSLNPCPSSGSQCFFDWGTTFPYLSYGLHFLLNPLYGLLPSGFFGSSADMGFIRPVLTGRLTSGILSTLTVVVIYRLAVIWYGVTAGLLAALAAALSGLLIQLAHFGTPDTTTVFLMSCSLLALASALKQPDGRRFAVAGTLAGLTAGSEYHMALLAVPFAAAWFLSTNRSPAWLLSGIACALAAFFVANPYILVESGDFLAALDHTVRIRTVDNLAQYQGRWTKFDPAWLYVVRFPLGYGVGSVFTVWFILGVGWAAIQRRKIDLVLLAWVIPYFLLVSWSSAKFMRYSAPLLPPLAVFAGAGASDSLGRLQRASVRSVGAMLLASAAVFTCIYDAAYVGLFATVDPRYSAVFWLNSRAVSGERIGFEELPNGLINLPYFASWAGYRPCFTEFRTKRFSSAMRYIALDDYNLEEHPRFPQSAVDAYRQAVVHSSEYRLAYEVHNVPTFLGMRFPIDGSPHDWRYPDHTIQIYSSTALASSPPSYCFPTLDAARIALYHPHVAQTG